MRRVELIWMPGLCAPWVEQGLTPLLDRPGAVRATLKAAFPAVPAVVEATILSGVAPSKHGRLGREVLTDRTPPLPLALDSWPELHVLRFGALWTALCRDGFPSASVREALREADDVLVAALTRASDDHVVVVCGGPGFRAGLRPRRIDLSHLPSMNGVAEGGILRVVVPGEAERDALRTGLLRTRGVGRVLSGRGLELWGALHPQAGDLVAVAEPTWSFQDEAIAYGTLDEPDIPPLLWVVGGRPRWPTDVHDVRLAPTLARFVGRPSTGFDDKPLDL